MRLSFKREFIFGSISILILSVLIAFSVVRYRRQTASLSTTSSTASIDPNTVLTSGEISKHNNSSDCWIIIENKVYAVSDFLARHPGGGGLITPYCGKDATQPFITKAGRGSHSATAMRLLGLIYIGDVNGKVLRQPDKGAIKSIQVGEGDDD